MNIRQHKIAIPERGDTNEVSSTIASFCLERVSRLQRREQGPSCLPVLRRQSRESGEAKAANVLQEKNFREESFAERELQRSAESFSSNLQWNIEQHLYVRKLPKFDERISQWSRENNFQSTYKTWNGLYPYQPE